jgi:hypothetical protein
MDISIFTNKQIIPNENNILESLGVTYELWKSIRGYVTLKYPDAIEEWNYSGDKYGWSFRIKDKKRAIIYLLPRDNYFKVAFVFGQNATDIIMESTISVQIKKELAEAKKYAEGRGIRIEINNKNILNDINKLIDIKLAN